MADRREHQRFVPSETWEGTMRVLQEVAVQRGAGGEFVAVSRAPAVVGDRLTLDLVGGGATMSVAVEVVDSRPIVVAGSVAYQVRLVPLPHAEPAPGFGAVGSPRP